MPKHKKKKQKRRIRVGSWNMQGTKQMPYQAALRLMEEANLDVLFVQEPGAGLVAAAQRPSASTRSTRQSDASQVTAAVVPNPGDRGGNIVVLSQPHLNVQVTPLQVQDRSLAVAEVNSGGSQFVIASMHAPEFGGSAGPQFMSQAAGAAAAAATPVDALIGDTNIYGAASAAPAAAARNTRSATQGETLSGFQNVPVGPTTRGGNPLDRVYSNTNSTVSVAAAGRLISNSGSSTRRIAATGDDVTVNVDTSTQAALSDSNHVPIYTDLEQ
jgi:hypothetical protein